MKHDSALGASGTFFFFLLACFIAPIIHLGLPVDLFQLKGIVSVAAADGRRKDTRGCLCFVAVWKYISRTAPAEARTSFPSTSEAPRQTSADSRYDVLPSSRLGPAAVGLWPPAGSPHHRLG